MSTAVTPTVEEAVNNKLHTMISEQARLLKGQNYTIQLLESMVRDLKVMIEEQQKTNRE